MLMYGGIMSNRLKSITTVGLHNQNLVYPLLSTTGFYLAFTAPLGYHHGFAGINLLSLDYILQLLLALSLYQISRNKIIFMLLQMFLMGLVYLSTPLKILYVTGDPVTPYDIASAWALFQILDDATRALIALLCIGLFSLFIYNIHFTRRTLFSLVTLILVLPISLEAASPVLSRWLDSAYPSQPWNRSYQYAVRGPGVYLLHETVKMINEGGRLPTQTVVAEAMATLNLHWERTAAKPVQQKRNLHIILVESLWDARQLPGLAQYPDPFDHSFRMLWEEGASSEVLSPVYTGGTANAEFELLCGLPVLSDRIVFEHEIRNETLPCLPYLLQQHGYRTVALHPNRKHFWNRAFAYPRLGIREFFSLASFAMDDRLGGRFLSDKSLLRQSRELPRDTSTPLFTYTLTIAGHFPYYLNAQRPAQVAWESGNETLDRYLNMIRYSTAEVVEHINILRLQDPDSLIVVLGDHSPFLGPNLEGYRTAGLLMKSNGQLDAATQLSLSSTPIIVIDGERGPQPLGQINLYALPSKLLQLLGFPDKMPLGGTAGSYALRYRPMAGMGMLVTEDEQVLRCDGTRKSLVCQQGGLWQQAVQILRLDMLRGNQHQLALSRQ
jgi:phosphoglycerol transferase MdoB-like AlkP superfamily enzyme